MEHRSYRPGAIFVVNFCFVNCHQFYIGDNYKDGDEIDEVVENRGHRSIMLNAILFYKLSSKFCSDQSGVIFLVQ